MACAKYKICGFKRFMHVSHVHNVTVYSLSRHLQYDKTYTYPNDPKNPFMESTIG